MGLLQKFKNIINSRKIVIDENFFELIEEQLISSDISIKIVEIIIKNTRKYIIKKRINSKKKIIDNIMKNLCDICLVNNSKFNNNLIKNKKPNIYLFVGVNGVGKTTSIAKLANYLKLKNKKVLIIASDTFRAGAVQQLSKWSKKINVECFLPDKTQTDPASVIYSGINYGKKNDFDYIICDSSGRFQNNKNLMNQLGKISRIINKVANKNPDEVFLVIDSTIGQNSIEQSREFSKAIKITSIFLTKIDGSARAGTIIELQNIFHIPIKLVGYGENEKDMRFFIFKNYVNNFVIGISE